MRPSSTWLARGQPWRTRPGSAGAGAQQSAPRPVSRACGPGVLAGDHALAGGHGATAGLPAVSSPPSHATRAGRRHGVINLLRWLSTFPGESWQQRWLTSGVEEHPGAGWVQLPLAWLPSTAGPSGRR